MRIFIFVAFLLFVSSTAWSHARLLAPVPRSPSDGVKSPAPCGPFAKAANAPTANVYTQGQSITVRFEETIDHPGKYLITLSTGNNDIFPTTPTLIVPDIQGAVPRQYMAQLQLPAGFTCDNCTLQLIQSMEENPAVPSFYYSCADIKVMALAAGAPTLAPIAAQATPVNTVKSVPLLAADTDSVLTCTATHFSATSSNPAIVVAADGITFSGTWPNCVADLKPEIDAVGTSNVAITLTDGASIVTQSFSFTTTAAAPPGGQGPFNGRSDVQTINTNPGFGCGLVSDNSSGSGPGANGGAMRWTLVLLMLPLVAISFLRRRARVTVRSFRSK